MSRTESGNASPGLGDQATAVNAAAGKAAIATAGSAESGPSVSGWARLRLLLEMIRFSHTVFALPFAMLAAVMAWTTPTPSGERLPFMPVQLVAILVCMVGARNTAMAFNRLADQRIDALNPRTRNRHLPSGSLSVASVIRFTVISAAVFVAGTFLFLPNPLPVILALPVLAFLCLYSYTKRFTAGAHFWLGAALMLAPVATWIALRGSVLLDAPLDALPAVVLGAAVLFWVAGFDMIYACQDAEFDAEHHLKSVPAVLGVTGALRLAAVSHLVMMVVLAAFPWICPQLGLSWPYGIGIASVAVMLAYEHSLVRPDDLTRVNVAFFNINAMVSIGLFVVGTIDLLT